VLQKLVADCVDERVAGDWDDVQVELGLKFQTDVPKTASRVERKGDLVNYFPEFSSTDGRNCAGDLTVTHARLVVES